MRRCCPLAKLLVIFLIGGCSGDRSADESDPAQGSSDEDDTLAVAGVGVGGGKADFVGLAQEFGYGESKTGSVEGRQVVLFKIDVAERDVLKLVVKRTSGTMDPRTEVYTVTGIEKSHDPESFENLAAGANAKRYTFGVGGTFLVAVLPNRWRGGGEFEITATCDGGACAGELINDADPVIASICIGKARKCAFEAVDEMNAGGGASTDDLDAHQLLRTCLSQTTLLGGDACAPAACEIDGDAKSVCAMIEAALVLVRDKGRACSATLTDCLDTCLEYEENSPWLEDDDISFSHTGEGVCWLDHNFHGTCDEYARAQVDCGGEVVVEDFDSCFGYASASCGAWNDDIDEACIPTCDYICEEIETGCGDDQGCVDRRQGEFGSICCQ